MTFTEIFLRIYFIIAVIGKAANGQRRQTQQQNQIGDHYEPKTPVHLSPDIEDYASFILSNNFIHSPSSYSSNFPLPYIEQQKVTENSIQYPKKGNGNSLATPEIAMEILGETFPSHINENPDEDGVNEYYQNEGQKPSIRKDSIDLSENKHNFRRLNAAAAFTLKSKLKLKPKQQFNPMQQRRQYERIFINALWPENFMNYMDWKNNNYEDNNFNDHDDSEIDVDENASNTNDIRPMLLHNVEGSDGIPFLRNIADKENFLLQSVISKRNVYRHPHYPYGFFNNNAGEGDRWNKDSGDKHDSKRERMHMQETTFIPSVSTGSITHLGHFFNDLSKNVRFNEHSDLHDSQEKLLQGNHPLQYLQSEINNGSDEESKIEKTAEFLQAIRSYRPSQKIRSLVSMNPQGYHGSNFLDPNYMWVGLG